MRLFKDRFLYDQIEGHKEVFDYIFERFKQVERRVFDIQGCQVRIWGRILQLTTRLIEVEKRLGIRPHIAEKGSNSDEVQRSCPSE